MRGRCIVGLLLCGAIGLGAAGGQSAQGDARASAREPGRQAADGERRVVRILAERFSFTPSEIRVARGTTLELRVRSDDTMHGFRIVGRNVNLLVPKRRQGEAVIVFDAFEPGRYAFECSRLCGAGHNFMRGAIVVEETAGRGEEAAVERSAGSRASSHAAAGVAALPRRVRAERWR